MKNSRDVNTSTRAAGFSPRGYTESVSKVVLFRSQLVRESHLARTFVKVPAVESTWPIRILLLAVTIALGTLPRAAPAVAAEPAGKPSQPTGSTTGVRAIRIDGTVVVGDWLGCNGQGTIEVRSADVTEIIPFDELMRVTLADAISARRDSRTHFRDNLLPVLDSESVAEIYLADGGFMRGELVGKPRPEHDPEHNREHNREHNVAPPLVGGAGAASAANQAAVVARCTLGDNVALPFDRLAGIQFADGEQYAEAAKLFQAALSDRAPGHDILVTRDAQTPKTLRGTLEELGPERGSFALPAGARAPSRTHQSRPVGNRDAGAVTDRPTPRVRTFRLEKIFGIVFAAGANKQPTYPATVELREGSVFSGQIRRLRCADDPARASSTQPKPRAKSLQIATSLGVEVDILLATVAQIHWYSDRVVYLSDLVPKDQRIEGRLHRPWSVQFDRNVRGGPISLGGQRFDKGVGVHSRTELDYDLGGRFETFVATIGIDDGVRPRGSVIFRVFGDGEIMYETAMLTGTDEPHVCRVDVAGVTLLTLVVDFGDLLDLADHADWAGARLLRAAGSSPRGL